MLIITLRESLGSHSSTHTAFVRYLIGWAARTFYGDQPFHDLFSLARSKSVSEFVEFTDQRNKVTKAWYKEVRQK